MDSLPRTTALPLDSLVEADDPSIYEVTTAGDGPQGSLPLTGEMLKEWPSGDLFGLTQNAGMGWSASDVARDPFLILSTQGGLRAPMASPSPWAITRVTGRSACSSARRPRSCELLMSCRSRGWSPTHATAGRRARPG